MAQRRIFDAYLTEEGADFAENGKRTLGNRLRSEAEKAAEEWRAELHRFLPTKADVEELPAGSWLLRLEFNLAKPFSSKAEDEFHPFEEREGRWLEMHNPLALDHLTGLPLVQPTTWKGHLRFAAGMAGIEETTINRLFGSSRGGESGQAGRLHFFPTFWDSVSKDEQGHIARAVATPLYRDTRTPVQGRAPINIEVVPAGTKGIFCLLYIPYPRGKDWSAEQIVEDLQASAEAVKAMLLEYGFSAKKTAGWGIAQNELGPENGKLIIKGALTSEAGQQSFLEPDVAFLKFMDDQGAVKSDYLGIDGNPLSKSQYRKRREGDTAIFEAFKSWYQEHGKEWVCRRTGKIAAYEEQIYNITDLEMVVERLIGQKKEAANHA
ncbi:MAG: hypothetical protein D9V47_05560 [Clostridia bacterium]|nr:MAG: hypothetical protein D9V47_05560 [Clostridia bacterium]